MAEIDQAAAALNVTARRLADLVQRERNLAAHASHQLRTPLIGLRAVLEGALANPDADMRTDVILAIERADRLESTIDELITLNRGGIVRTPIDAAAQLDAAEARWRGSLAAAGRPLRLVLETELPSPLVAESALRQILDALIENAFAHGTGTVTLKAREAHGAVAFDVEDEGHDIALHEDIFRHGVSASGGSGLGLALARQLAEDQGGRLLLAGRMPHTCFTLILPVHSDATVRAFADGGG
jgi:signal transduction histidine kinase